MIICKNIAELKNVTQQWKKQNNSIALIPTMGNLHRGHMHLVQHAGEKADKVIVSIFVNPLQFAPHEDFATYPRTPEEDIKNLSQHKVDALFMPEMREIITEQSNTQVTVSSLANKLCGLSRPIFFQGVCTIVCKLFHIAEPDMAVFGEKDYQQLLIVKQMVKDLNFSMTILPVATVRDHDGLALSSRNRYLTEQQRQLAPQLYSRLDAIKKQIMAGAQDFQTMANKSKQILTQLGFNVDYLEICRSDNLQPPDQESQELLIAAAVYLDKTRLIDNVRVKLS